MASCGVQVGKDSVYIKGLAARSLSIYKILKRMAKKASSFLCLQVPKGKQVEWRSTFHS